MNTDMEAVLTILLVGFAAYKVISWLWAGFRETDYTRDR